LTKPKARLIVFLILVAANYCDLCYEENGNHDNDNEVGLHGVCFESLVGIFIDVNKMNAFLVVSFDYIYVPLKKRKFFCTFEATYVSKDSGLVIFMTKSGLVSVEKRIKWI
jgi:hypothetical protein